MKHTNTETDNIALYTIEKVDNERAKSSCAPTNRYKATLCTPKVYVATELHCEPWFACSLSTTKCSFVLIAWCTRLFCMNVIGYHMHRDGTQYYVVSLASVSTGSAHTADLFFNYRVDLNITEFRETIPLICVSLIYSFVIIGIYNFFWYMYNTI